MQRETIETALTELDELLERDAEAESEFQSWFERHPAVFAVLGLASVVPHPEIRVSAKKKYIPDFIAQLPNDLWTILELKTPRTHVLKAADKRQSFYVEFEQYLSQCAEYSEAFDSENVRDEFESRTGHAVQKRPDSIIVAGRSNGLDAFAVHDVLSRRKGITHYTFDDVRRGLERSRVFQHGEYEEARGFALHSILRLYKPPQNEPSWIFDAGAQARKNHVSTYLDRDGVLRLTVIDSNGERHEARSTSALQDEDYQRPHLVYFEGGTAPRFGFLSIQIDGKYSADIRTHEFPFTLSNEFAMGTNAFGTGSSWMAMYEQAVYARPLPFAAKGTLRSHALGRILEIEQTQPPAVGFAGNQFLSTEGHSSRNHVGQKLEPQTDREPVEV